MRKLIVTEFMSLDGVFESPGPEGAGYKYEGWTFGYDDNDFMQFKLAELRDAEMLLLGRVTYDAFAIAWPKMSGDEFSDKFNSMPKYVVSKTLKKASWNNSHIISENVVEEIKKLKEGDGKNIYVHGSGGLARFLLKNSLVDQLNILLYPVILGEGKKLFEGSEKTALELIETTTFSSKVVKLLYKPKQSK